MAYGDGPMYNPSVFDLMQKMEYAYLNPKLMVILGQANRNIIIEKHSWEVVRPKLIEALKE
jgi:glycosyltransferase involved in cell wall biosynthesis